MYVGSREAGGDRGKESSGEERGREGENREGQQAKSTGKEEDEDEP